MPTKSGTALRKLIATGFSPEAGAPAATEVQTRIEEIDARIERLQSVKRSDFLPYEAGAIMTKTKNALTELQTEKTNIGQEFGLKLRQHAIHVAVAEKGYPQQLDLTMLSMGHNMGSTFLVTPYENDSGICKVKVEMDRRTRKYRAYFTPRLPKAIDDLMQKAWEEFAYYFGGEHTEAELSSNFEGCADKSMADVIAAVAKAKKSRAFDRILVIAEVGAWQVDKLVRVQQDPLIIGWVDSTSQSFYITDYDMTPLEQYFRNQFAYGVTKHTK